MSVPPDVARVAQLQDAGPLHAAACTCPMRLPLPAAGRPAALFAPWELEAVPLLARQPLCPACARFAAYRDEVSARHLSKVEAAS